jgi:hypothetical protein
MGGAQDPLGRMKPRGLWEGSTLVRLVGREGTAELALRNVTTPQVRGDGKMLA